MQQVTLCFNVLRVHVMTMCMHVKKHIPSWCLSGSIEPCAKPFHIMSIDSLPLEHISLYKEYNIIGQVHTVAWSIPGDMSVMNCNLLTGVAENNGI